MHASRSFGGWRDYNELLRMISEATDRGHISEIKPSSDVPHGYFERWFVEHESGIVFRLVEPDPPAPGDWSEIEFPSRSES
jgi:hypothetical protein